MKVVRCTVAIVGPIRQRLEPVHQPHDAGQLLMRCCVFHAVNSHLFPAVAILATPQLLSRPCQVPPRCMSAGDRGDRWDLSDSDSSAQDQDGDVAALALPRDVQPRGRGRPPSANGAILMEFLAERQVVRRVPNEHTGTVSSFLRPGLGAFIHRAVTAGVLRGVREELDTELQALSREVLGDTPRHCMTVQGEARMLNQGRKMLPDRLVHLAAAVFFSSRAWINSLCSHLRVEFSQSRLKPLAVYIYMQSDETSLPMAGHEWDAKWVPVESQTQASQADERGRKYEGVTKVLQTECAVSFMVQSCSTGRTKILEVPMLCPLQSMDAANGECLATAFLDSLSTPGLQDIFSLFPRKFIGANLDRAGANDRGWGGLTQHHFADFESLRLPCDAHIISTVTGRSYSVADACITGVLSVALGMSPGGAYAAFRRVLIEILETVQVVDGPPAPDDSSLLHIRRRNCLFDLCLPKTEAGIKRRACLCQDINSDTMLEAIVWYRVGGATPAMRKAWAQRVADNLMPSRIAKFSRTRWLTTLDPITSCALLCNVWHLLPRAILRWKLVMESKNPGPVASALWEPWHADTSDEDVSNDHRDARADPGHWAKWNSDNRRDAGTFARSMPAGILYVTATCLQPLVVLLRSTEYVAGDAWFEKQMHRCVTGAAFESRLEHAASLSATNAYFDGVRRLMFSLDAWTGLPPAYSTVEYAGIAFAMMSRAMAGVQTLLVDVHSSFPVSLFRLIHNPGLASQIRRTPGCMLDAFSKNFLASWKSEAALSSVAARAELFLIATAMRMEITRIECRHAYIRRLVKLRVQSRKAAIRHASASFVLMRQRCMQKAGWSSVSPKTQAKPPPPKCRRRRSGRLKGAMVGGGGAMRAGMSFFLKQVGGGGHQSKERLSELWRQAHQLRREAPEELQMVIKAMGQAGTASFRSGAKRSFGGRLRASSAKRMCRRILPLHDNGGGALALVDGQAAAAQAVVPLAGGRAVIAQALVEQREAEAQLATASFRDSRRKKQAEQTACREQLQEWSVQHAVALSDIAIPSITTGACVAPLLPPDEMKVDFCQWVPPGIELAETALADKKLVSGERFGLRKALSKAWSAKHTGIKASDLPELQIGSERVTACYLAGFCVCKDNDADAEGIRAMVAALTQVLSNTCAGGWMKPKTACRELYDKSKAIFNESNPIHYVPPPTQHFRMFSPAPTHFGKHQISQLP